MLIYPTALIGATSPEVADIDKSVLIILWCFQLICGQINVEETTSPIDHSVRGQKVIIDDSNLVFGIVNLAVHPEYSSA